ncbi:MAG: hypothetical protein Q8P95_04845, partial [bacterium]|nr:hypothetical protein [bacterium]
GTLSGILKGDATTALIAACKEIGYGKIPEECPKDEGDGGADVTPPEEPSIPVEPPVEPQDYVMTPLPFGWTLDGCIVELIRGGMTLADAEEECKLRAKERGIRVPVKPKTPPAKK